MRVYLIPHICWLDLVTKNCSQNSASKKSRLKELGLGALIYIMCTTVHVICDLAQYDLRFSVYVQHSVAVLSHEVSGHPHTC